jgi:xylulose-5-phosphate/fructose-6-phosphate phosphoketolase
MLRITTHDQAPVTSLVLEGKLVGPWVKELEKCWFTTDKPIVFNFHGYPWLIHRLAYTRTNHKNLHVRGYKERGNINTPMELAINNQIDRFTLAIDVIDRVPKLQATGAHAKEQFRNEQISCRRYAHEHGIDKPEVIAWRWPF